MTAPKIDRKLTEFVTPEGLLTFPFLFPGQAQKSFREGSFSYKVEWVGTVQPTDQVAQVASLVAQANDQAVVQKILNNVPQFDMYGQPIMEPNWPKHIFGAKGKIKMLHETDRDQSKYPYAQGKHILTISSVHDAENMKLCARDEVYDMTDPEKRENFQKALQSHAPRAYKFCEPGNQADLHWVAEENKRRAFSNKAPQITEDQISNTLRDLMPHEIWSGCYGRVMGQVYWSRNAKPTTIGFSLTHVLLTRTGERLAVSATAPDVAFRAFAPAAELAPPGFVPPNMGVPPPGYPGFPFPAPQPGLPQPLPMMPALQLPPQQDPWANLR